ncbi:GNAT family N-acetyltransferase [Anaerorhabdus sp.]|uniref:GNAT family N-acetyltransferase n=1 Tax=Anaerorhabdus sp. TaxID=1872524 RepID=UPI002B1EB7F5|nr:GNAT family N-acetyltransferase [Anaerorhabdus sp.]MEA4874346.1 GNAT family N-acetyltransferase [Anaerorhabdus sp.]
MQIRKMTIEDYENIYHLWINTPGMGLNNLDDSKEGIERYLNRNPNTCFVALDDNVIVGAIISGHDGRRGYIHHTAIALEKQNQGIGTALVKAALDALENEQITKVALVVFDTNEKGNAFWEKCGFIKRNDLIYRNKTIKNMTRIDTK